VLDCILGGGWLQGSVINVVGDKSTGKTLMAIEACANFARQWPRGYMWYREAEAAFDINYASGLGLPHKRVNFGPKGLDSHWDTVEDVFEDLRKCIDKCKSTGQPGLYVVDSWDALTSRAMLSRKVGDAGYNLEKQKITSTELAKLVRDLREARITLLIISQVRDRIGFVVGEKHRRSGGKALDFYASQIVWLSHLKTLTQTIKGVKRAYGVRVRVKCKKNKAAAPSRDAEFTIRFGYGIQDVEASVGFLEEVKRLDVIGLAKKSVDDYLDETDNLPGEAYRERAAQVRDCVMSVWSSVESWFKPAHSKYGD